MPFDANLVLRGEYGGAMVDLDENDVTPTSLTMNADGNVCVDLGPHGTAAQGLDVVVIFEDTVTDYQDTLDIQICDSDQLTDGWELAIEFPRVYCYMRELVVTAVTAFVATDIGLVLTAGDGDTGIIRQLSRELLTVGGVGKIFVEMQDAGDTYATDGDTVDAATGTGDGTLVGVGRVPGWGLTPQTMVRRLSTPKRYIRCTNTVSAGGNFGAVHIMATNAQHNPVNNLLK